MLADDFFETKLEEPKVEEAEPEKVKVGEKEYTQEELSKVVGLGEIGLEAESKYNVKIDKIWPNHQQTINEKLELEKKLKEFEEKQVEAKPQDERSTEDIKQLARKEARELGLISVDDVNDYIYRVLESRDLKEDIEATIETNKGTGKPETNFEDLVGYMQASGVRNPQDAYDLMFKNEIKTWERQQIDSVKKPGMVTEETSTAGAKEPPITPITKDNIADRLDEVLFPR